MRKYFVAFTAWEVLEPDFAGVGDEHLGYFSTSAEAEKYKKQYEGPCPRRVRKVVIDKSWTVCDTIKELDQLNLETKKVAALAKLTDEERKLLGLE